MPVTSISTKTFQLFRVALLSIWHKSWALWVGLNKKTSICNCSIVINITWCIYFRYDIYVDILYTKETHGALRLFSFLIDILVFSCSICMFQHSDFHLLSLALSILNFILKQVLIIFRITRFACEYNILHESTLLLWCFIYIKTYLKPVNCLFMKELSSIIKKREDD